jgi:hypothetical protein
MSEAAFADRAVRADLRRSEAGADKKPGQFQIIKINWLITKFSPWWQENSLMVLGRNG